MPIFEGNGVLRSGNVFLSNENDSLRNESIFCRTGDRGKDVPDNPQHFSFQRDNPEHRIGTSRAKGCEP